MLAFFICIFRGYVIYICPDVEKNKGEFENDEYFIKDHYGSVSESLKLFSSDDLLYPPGSFVHI